MSKLNKIITNRPVVLTNEEVNNLSETLSAVRTAGGGEGGHLYTGDNKYIGVDNGNYKIKFLDNAAEKLESISSKLDKTEAANTYLTSADAQTLYQTKEAMSYYAQKTDLPDSITDFADTSAVIYSYINPATADIQQQINGKQTKLKFDLNDKGEISAIGPEYGTTTALAGANGITGDYYSASNPSGFINSTQAETQILEKHYLTEASGDLYYLPIPSELIEGTQYAYTTQGWSPIQGGGGASGISFVNHDDTLIGDGNTVKLGVDFTKVQTKLSDAEIQNIADVTTLKTASSTWDNVSAKLNTTDFNTYTGTTAPSTYQPKGNYLSSNALEGYATQDWVNEQGYIKQETDWTNTIQEASAKAYNDATANANSLYQAKGDYVKNTDISLDANNKITAISGKELIITAHQSLTDYYTKSQTSGAIELSTEFGKYALKSDIPTVPTKVSDLTDSANYYKTTETSSKNELSTEFAKYVTSSNVSTPDSDYVMTTTGWKVLTLPGGGMTQVIHDDTLTGQGNADNSKLGVVWSALSGNTIYSAIKANSASAAKRLQDSTEGPIIQVGDVTALQHWASSNSSTWDGVSAKLGTAQYAIDSATFVTSSNDSISAAGEQYALTTTGWSKVQAGSTLTAGSGVEIVSNGINALLGTDLAFNTTTSAIQINTDGTVYGAYAFVEGSNTTASGAGAHAEGADAGAIGQGAHAGGYGTHTTGVGNFIHGTFLNFASPDGTTVSNTPVFVGGTLNATTAQDYTDHGGYLQIMGNGVYRSGGQGDKSDAYILYRDGSITAAGKISANGMFAVASAATLIGASRQTSSHYGVDNTALGTTWIGVGSNGMHQGFIKYTDGGDVGALDSNNTIQINFKPENAGYNGEMTITNVNGETTSQSKVVNVPTASYNSMSSFDNTNGPNYMLRKTASGFDIGAAVINVTALPATTEANAYYFVYDI